MITVLFLAPACSSGDAEPEATTTATVATSTTTTEAQCAGNAPTFTTPWMEKVLSTATLPDGAIVVSEQSLYNVDDRTMIDSIVRVCAPGVTGDELKDVGTAIAQALRPLPEADMIESLRVTNTAESGDDARIRCEDFQVYTWDDAAAVSPRTNWKTSAES
ncbi:hypothetical protein [Gordonia amicalis]|uniref:Lipoprotein n=1 Tax=Gordonia amicalis TaxID=89053 RepID=A0ABU4DL40_9ACTN|nr:hypothetical protein [Gordonia amicalis]MDV6309947.1 hypothetical protein [Gordonia amicalis]